MYLCILVATYSVARQNNADFACTTTTTWSLTEREPKNRGRRFFNTARRSTCWTRNLRGQHIRRQDLRQLSEEL